MNPFSYKYIADPIYKSIGLSQIEAHVIDTPVFQRLRGIKHLGLVSLVYPGADFSRFDHSLGVCHVTGQILASLNISVDVIQTYRLAALLHDIGHYPFSHPMEEAIKNFYSGTYLVRVSDQNENDLEGKENTERYIDHEKVGKEILHHDKLLRDTLVEAGHDPNYISSIFVGERRSEFANLIKSDLDADRIDYLLRTAHHTGLPYGSVDLAYLLNQMKLDGDKKIVVHERALRAAEHLLLSRYFVYQQTIYHKTVVAFEHILKNVLQEMLGRKRVQFSRNDVTRAIQNGEWHGWNDAYIMQKIVEVAAEGDIDSTTKKEIDSICLRKPPSLVAEREELKSSSDTQYKKDFQNTKNQLKEKIPAWAKKFGIDQKLWALWDLSGLTLTSIGSVVSTSAMAEVGLEDKYEQTVRVGEANSNASRSIIEHRRSLMSVMSNYSVYCLRVYVLISERKNEIRKEIQDCIKSEIIFFQ